MCEGRGASAAVPGRTERGQLGAGPGPMYINRDGRPVPDHSAG